MEQASESNQIDNQELDVQGIEQKKVKKQNKQKKQKTIKICTTRCRGEYKLIKQLIQQNVNWVEKFNEYDSDIVWSGLDILSEDYGIAREAHLNRYPGLRQLCHKKQTGFFLNKFREYFPEYFKFFPRTFLYPEQQEEFKEYAKSKKKNKMLFIAKPTSGSQGDGIQLINKLDDLKFSLNQELVIQRYLDKPMIIDKKKFDLRLYVLISSLNPLIAYLNDEGLARFCTEDYEYPSPQNIKNQFMHLSNYSLNKMNPNFKYSEEIYEINDGSKRTLKSLWKSIEKEGFDVAYIKQEIEELIVKFLKSMHPFLMNYYQSVYGYKQTDKQAKCFHVIGFDILLDEKMKPWVLEINGNPSFSIEHEQELTKEQMQQLLLEEKEKNQKDLQQKKSKPISSKLNKNTTISPIDQHVKGMVIEDTIKIVSKSIMKQMEIGEGEHFNSFKQIFCEEIQEYQHMNIFLDILKIFQKLSGVKYDGELTSGKFVNLSRVPGLSNQDFPKASYDILFTKLTRDTYKSTIDFNQFILAIERLTSILYKEYDPNNKFETVKLLVDKIKQHYQL